MNPPTGIRNLSPSCDEDRDGGYPSKRVRMSPSVPTSHTAPITADASPANSTSTYLGASPTPTSAHPDSSHSDFPPHSSLTVSHSDAFESISSHPTQTIEHSGEGLEKVENKLAPKTGSSSFRNVSACNRCRLRKNRCDQRLPSCASCGKAGVRCTGYDPITKREIPRR